ncbi:TPR-like protein [Dioscorea alata]|uniref:TPR-like protein n=2 Tax=Dioscorea alata TaxID=55571 RepID=A0ACB7USH2_DIOAL|nr:TPR-like protein [Dioscorea alata]KAH7663618.1 TPR-like protein [Dioscorea alata]
MARLFSRPLDFESIVRVLRGFRRVGAVNHGKSLHSQLIKLGICGSTFVANNLMSMYSEIELLDDARKIFVEMPERNVVSWTALISAHIYAGEPFEALRVFDQMLEFGLEEPNGFTFSAALKACGLLRDIKYGQWIHELVSRAGLLFDTVLMNSVLDMYVKCGSVEEARRVFDVIFPGKFTSWNTMIAGYCKEGNMAEAEELFLRAPQHDGVSFNSLIAGFARIESPKASEYVCLMHKRGFKLDHFTFPCALNTCGSLGLEKLGMQIHSYIVKYGFESCHYTGPALVDMYGKCSRINEARELFDQYSHQCPLWDRVPLFNSMLSGYVCNQNERAALDLILKIYKLAVGMDAYTLSSALKVCINLQNLRIGMQVHSLIVTNGCHLDSIVGSVLVDLYTKCCRLDDARKVFAGLLRKDAIAWSGLITGCVQQGSHGLAFSLFRDMISSSVGLDCYVVSSIVKACSVLSTIQSGKQVHTLCIKSGFDSENVTVASLIDMYSKCGDIDDGLAVFESVTNKDAVIWTGMIIGCGNNGRAMKAINLFEKMLESEEKPNEITFLGVLSACRHAGMVGEACAFFKQMKDTHGLAPTLEHYCCMVDILSRDGRFKEAKKLIGEMPCEANETILNSLLGAYAIHQNADLSKLVSKELLQDPIHDTSHYVTLSNVCASLGLWDGSAKLREMIRRVSQKEAGRSWLGASP